MRTLFLNGLQPFLSRWRTPNGTLTSSAERCVEVSDQWNGKKSCEFSFKLWHVCIYRLRLTGHVWQQACQNSSRCGDIDWARGRHWLGCKKGCEREFHIGPQQQRHKLCEVHRRHGGLDCPQTVPHGPKNPSRQRVRVPYLAKALGGSDQATLDEKKRHDKALEAYQAAYNKYSRERTQLLDWIETKAQIKAQAKQNFTNTDYAFKLYNQPHPASRLFQRKSQSSLISISRVSSRKKASSFSWVRGPLPSATPRSVSFELLLRRRIGNHIAMDAMLAKTYSKHTTVPGATGKAAGGPRARVHGRCFQRDGKTQNFYPARAHGDSPRPRFSTWCFWYGENQ